MRCGRGCLNATLVFESVQTDLGLVEEAIRRVGDVEYPFLGSLLEHVLATRGKRVRPALVLLSASFNEYRLEHLVPLAAAIELLHTATLVHDDLIDNSDTRRGKATLHNLTSKAATVLVGDYLFANAAALCTETESVAVMRVFGQALMTIVDGELKQLFSSGFWRQSREEYYRKIEGKTASLLRTATETGAILSRASEEQIATLSDYGYNLGMAFQIVDDVLDFTSTAVQLGKPVGSDLRAGHDDPSGDPLAGNRTRSPGDSAGLRGRRLLGRGDPERRRRGESIGWNPICPGAGPGFRQKGVELPRRPARHRWPAIAREPDLLCRGTWYVARRATTRWQVQCRDDATCSARRIRSGRIGHWRSFDRGRTDRLRFPTDRAG